MGVGELYGKEAGTHTTRRGLLRVRSVDPFPMLLFCMGLLLYAYRLGDVHFWSAAEGASAMAARQLLVGGNWMLPNPPSHWLVQAPPLYTWLVAGCFWFSGSHSEAVARLPSVLAAVATLIVVYRQGCRIGSPRLGRTAALVTGLCVLFVWQARLAEADTLLCLWTALAYSAALGALGGERGQFAVFHAALGLAILTKGMVALLFVAAPLAAYLTWQRQWRGVVGRREFWVTFPVLLALGCAWYVYLVLLAPHAFQGLSWSEIVRSSGHREPVYYYLTRLPLALLPLTLVLPWALALPWRRGEALPRRSAARLAFCWLVGPSVALLLWPGKQTHYLLPLVPALGLLAALVLEGRPQSSGFWSLPSRAHAAKLAAWLIPVVCAVSAPVLATRGHPDGAWLLLGIAAVLSLVSLAARLSLDWSRRFGLEAVLVELWVVLLVVCGHLLPQFNLEKSHKPFLRVVRRLVPDEEPLGGVQLRANDLYYLDRSVTPLAADLVESGPAEYVVASRRWLDSQPADRYSPILQSDAVGRNADLVLIRVRPVAMGAAELRPKR